MAIETAYNPNADLNKALLEAGASKTVYALTSLEVEWIKARVFGSLNTPERAEYTDQFREAWTSKQDAYHEEFFDEWVKWSKPVVNFDRTLFPFYYPTAGASEALRQLIFEFAVKGGETIHVFEGEYEGYKAMAEAARLKVKEHKREDWEKVQAELTPSLNTDLFFISQPSAIDGNVWLDFNQFVKTLGENTVVADVTYVGAVPRDPFLFSVGDTRIDLSSPSIRNVVFSLSKPFGAYYDRIGGVWCREQSEGLFGNKWFKNLTSLDIGKKLMQFADVFYMHAAYAPFQKAAARIVGERLDMNVFPSDVYVLATAHGKTETPLSRYIARAGLLRLCLTPGMVTLLKDAGKIV